MSITHYGDQAGKSPVSAIRAGVSGMCHVAQLNPGPLPG